MLKNFFLISLNNVFLRKLKFIRVSEIILIKITVWCSNIFYIFMLSFYVTLGLISPWLVWNSYLFYYLLKEDKSFNLFIISRSQLNKYLAYVLFLLAISMYIFLVRFNNIGRVVNLNLIFKEIYKIFKALTWQEYLGLGIFAILLLIFWILFTRVILHYLKQTILALYLYYFQYSFFREICYWCVDRASEYTFYLIRRVSIFTNNVTIRGKSMLIWPWGIELIARNIYFCILPYVIIFDIIINDGEISKLFVILPWFYLYTLFKGFWYLVDNLYKRENRELTEEAYGIQH